MVKKSSEMETVSFDDTSLASQLFGPHSINLEALKKLTGANISNRGSRIFIESDDNNIRRNICNVFVQIYSLMQDGFIPSKEDICRAYEMLKSDPGLKLRQVFLDAVFVNTPRKIVTARNLAQKCYLEVLKSSEIVFASGPAGTGKTYLAVAMALSMLQQHKIKRIVLTRPAVEAGEKLGFLPGDLVEKVNPYLRPLYDALYDMVPHAKVATMLETGVIEIAPLAFMRGRTLNESFVILDEAQNTTQEQMKMFLTRMGFGSRMIITGDVTQIDLPVFNGVRQRSGLIQALDILRDVSEIAIHEFSAKDVVRHPLVGAIVKAYDKAEKCNKTV